MSATTPYKSVPDRIEQRPIIHRKIWSRMHQKDKNWMGIITGQTGSGKSEFGLRLCEIIDPDFGPDQIAFTIPEFLELVQDRSYGPGSMILFDEVGIALSHAKHYEDDLIKVNHILQSWREQNRGLVMTAPHMGLIHSSDRGLLHAHLEMWGINQEHHLSTARYRNVIQDSDSGDLYKKYPRLRDPKTGLEKKYRFLELWKPTPAIVEPYVERKVEFNDQLNEDVFEQVNPEEDEIRSKSPKEIVELIKSDGVENVVSIHGGHNKTQFDKDLIRAEYGLSHNDSKAVKKLLDRDDAVDLEEVGLA